MTEVRHGRGSLSVQVHEGEFMCGIPMIRPPTIYLRTHTLFQSHLQRCTERERTEIPGETPNTGNGFGCDNAGMRDTTASGEDREDIDVMIHSQLSQIGARRLEHRRVVQAAVREILPSICDM